MTTGTLFTPDELADIKARVRLSSLIGRQVKLAKAGRHWKAVCPFHHEKTASFSVRDDEGTYHCYGCSAHGDAFRWLQESQGLSFPDAVRALVDDVGLAGPLSIEKKHVERDRGAGPEAVDSTVVGKWIWTTSVWARQTIVERWLSFRGLDPWGLPGALDRLRFHPRCPIVSWLEGQTPDHLHRRGLTAPAMVAPIAAADGKVYGVHCTYLAPDGAGKADLPRTRGGEERETRKMFGRLARRAVWLTASAGPGPLVVGEGIETSWSWAEEYWRVKGPCRVAAALSLNNLQGGYETLKGGALPLWRPRSNPAAAPFLVEKPGDVVVLVDADMKPLRGQKVQLARGEKPVLADLSGLQRAELCAALAVQAWRRAGATRVRAERPPMGHDFNDLKRMEAA